jgi:hypothetical protein
MNKLVSPALLLIVKMVKAPIQNATKINPASSFITEPRSLPLATVPQSPQVD